MEDAKTTFTCTNEYVTSADSQNISGAQKGLPPNRAPSHGPSLLYAQRENRLVMETRDCRK